MTIPLRNPYIAGNPISGPEMFFGRADVFEFLQGALIGQYRDNIIVLYGQRRTGKTSVLNQLPRILAPRYLCVFIDLHGLAMDGLGGFLWELANYTRLSLRKNYQVEIPPMVKAEFLADPRQYFVQIFLENVWAATGDRHLLLMLDEAIRLEEQVKAGKLEPQIFEYLRSLMQSNPRLNFLFSLGSGLEEMEKEYAFLFNVALYKKISFLDRASAAHLITDPVKAFYTVQPEAIDHILAITSGHPYFTQLICHSIFNDAQTRALTTITPADIDRILGEAVERGMAVLRHVWDDAAPVEKVVLAGMAAAANVPGREGGTSRPVSLEEIGDVWAEHLNIPVPRGEMVKAMHTLSVRDVIVGSELVDEKGARQQAYRFTVDLQRRFIEKNYPLELVWEMIKEQAKTWQAQERPKEPPAGPVSSAPAEEQQQSKFTLQLKPPRLVAGQVGIVTITNLSNTKDTFNVSWYTQVNDLIFEPAEANVTVLAGRAAEVQFRAKDLQRRLLGSPKVFPFTTIVRRPLSRPQEVDGAIISRAVIPLWLLVLAAVLLLAGAGYSIFRAAQDRQVIAAAQTTATVQHSDPDSDGVTNIDEEYFGTDPNNPDHDGDGLMDGKELSDTLTSPTNPDTDGDSLSDGDEVNTTRTDPTNPDTDGDGAPDNLDPAPNALPTETATLPSSPTVSPAETAVPAPTLAASRTNPVDGHSLLLIPAGEFVMGLTEEQVDYICAIDKTCHKDLYHYSQPVHQVFLSDYYIYETEVTNGSYALCVLAGVCAPPSRTGSDKRRSYYDNPEFAEYPVVYVTWFQADTYCRWAGGRLPTEAQWEKAARGETGNIWPWGNNPPDATRGRMDRIGQPENDTAAVGSYPAGASPYGVLDMAGNVFEWVADIFDAGYYQVSPYENPTGPPSTGVGDNLRTRVVRGGSWGFGPWIATGGLHDEEDPLGAFPGVGFRCVVDVLRN